MITTEEKESATINAECALVAEKYKGSRAKIDKLVTFSSGNYWYVVYNDSDSMSDYFHSYSGSQAKMAQYIKEDGADLIEVQMQNGHDNPEAKLYKAVERLAKRAGYEVAFLKEKRTTFDGLVWYEQTARLRKVPQ